MKNGYKKIITDRGDEFYVKFSTGNGYGFGDIYCTLYKKRKIPFLYKELEYISASSMIISSPTTSPLPTITNCSNVSEIDIETKKRLTKEVVDKYYAYIARIEKNKKDSEQWDGVMGENMKREKRLEKLLDKDK